MKDKEKNAVMQDFKDKNLDLLVSTTVIEVGVDVPDASVMVIYDAERFGLSQLHQLLLDLQLVVYHKQLNKLKKSK